MGPAGHHGAEGPPPADLLHGDVVPVDRDHLADAVTLAPLVHPTLGVGRNPKAKSGIVK
jgi:hypothetical protein